MNDPMKRPCPKCGEPVLSKYAEGAGGTPTYGWLQFELGPDHSKTCELYRKEVPHGQ
jgi:hypothetical protein